MREAQARRDVGEVAIRCGEDPGPEWTAVRDNAGLTHMYVQRSKRDPDRRHEKGDILR